MKKLLALLLCCLLLTGCTRTPDIAGTWVTSHEAALCGTVLVIEEDRFTLTQEGVTRTGHWVHDVGNILLYEDVENPAQSETVWMAGYDKATGTLTLGDIPLHRK